MRELVLRKDQLVAQRATPPLYLKVRGGRRRLGCCRGCRSPACWPLVPRRRPCRSTKLPGLLAGGASALGVAPAASAGRGRASSAAPARSESAVRPAASAPLGPTASATGTASTITLTLPRRARRAAQADLKQLRLGAEALGTRFDPPWEEYARRAPGLAQPDAWTWAEIQGLELEAVMDTPSFIFLWRASGAEDTALGFALTCPNPTLNLLAGRGTSSRSQPAQHPSPAQPRPASPASHPARPASSRPGARLQVRQRGGPGRGPALPAQVGLPPLRGHLLD